MASPSSEVAITVPRGPLGLELEADSFGNAAVLKSFKRLPSGRMGPVQKAGSIPVGYVLCKFNGRSVMKVPFRDVMKQLASRQRDPRRNLVFKEPIAYYRERGDDGAAPRSGADSGLQVLIRSFRVNRTASSPFADYEIVASLRQPGRKLRDSVKTWTVWHRYSEFLALDTALREQYGWQMDSIIFPGKKWFGTLSHDFLAERMRALNDWFRQVLALPNVYNFKRPHLSSTELKTFIEFDSRGGVLDDDAAPDMTSGGAASFWWRWLAAEGNWRPC
eukprot:PLAT14020.1.p1 GENE.PLAT14020.1~~PLAT14020.1.p1  ORF type:complete len:276 (+),score=91.16 PLAT14020.1:46-873(+)